MAAAFMWCVIGLAACLIGMVCMIPGWVIRKIREHRELTQIRSLYPNNFNRRGRLV